MRKITRAEFDKQVRTKIYKGKWDAMITWGSDFYQLADTEQQAKDNLFRKLTTD